MNFNVKNEKRRIIPRWRNFNSVAASGELSPFQPKNVQGVFPKTSLEKARKEWDENNSIITATELLSAAIVCGSNNDLKTSAEYILSNKLNARKSVIKLAETVLDRKNLHEINENSVIHSLLLLPGNVIKEIHLIKRKLKDWPRHATLWADLSRLYAIMGEDEKALRAMNISLQLNGNNRFILRSATRLNVHLNNSEEAIKIIKNSGRVKYDPWILAAEVAVNTILGRSSNYMKLGVKYVQNNKNRAFHISELASAIGTVELKSGLNKKAKQYFKDSLLCPNDNALAQAEWASQKLIGLDTSKRLIIPKSFEAKTRHAFANYDWDNALQCCYEWVWDEPFSSIPAAAGSFIAESIFQNHEQAIEFCEHGLRSNREDIELLNNLTVSLACSGRIEEAKETFKKIKNIDKKNSLFVTTTATSGLISYRQENFMMGREYYDLSIESAEKMNRNDLKAIAAIYAAREEKISKGEKTEEYSKRAAKFVEKENNPKIDAIAKGVLSNKSQ